MEIERAKELTGGCVKTHLAIVCGGEYVPLPEAPLRELLEANETVAAQSSEPNVSGGRVIHWHCDPRVVALHYAFENYGRNPYQLMEALGYEVAVRRD